MYLTIDDHPLFLKKIYCVLANKAVEELVETRSFWVKVAKELNMSMHDDDSCGLEICRFLWYAIKIKYERKFNKRKADVGPNHPVIVEAIADDNAVEKAMLEVQEGNKEEMSIAMRKYKPYALLSTKRKVHRIKEMRELVMKVANPSCEDGQECFEEIHHVIEDTIKSFKQKLKIHNNKLNQSNSHSLDDCSSNVVIDEDEVDMDLTRFFDLELSNSKHFKVRKLLKDASTNVMSKYELSKQCKDFNYIGFKIKWIQNQMDAMQEM